MFPFYELQFYDDESEEWNTLASFDNEFLLFQAFQFFKSVGYQVKAISSGKDISTIASNAQIFIYDSIT